MIATQVWEDEAEAVGSNTIDVHVGRVRGQAGLQPGAHRDGAWNGVPDGRVVRQDEGAPATRRSGSPQWRPLIVMVGYVIAAIVVNLIVTNHLVGTDGRAPGRPAPGHQ